MADTALDSTLIHLSANQHIKSGQEVRINVCLENNILYAVRYIIMSTYRSGLDWDLEYDIIMSLGCVPEVMIISSLKLPLVTKMRQVWNLWNLLLQKVK